MVNTQIQSEEGRSRMYHYFNNEWIDLRSDETFVQSCLAPKGRSKYQIGIDWGYYAELLRHIKAPQKLGVGHERSALCAKQFKIISLFLFHHEPEANCRNGCNGISLNDTSIADVIGGEGFAIAQRIDSKGGNEAKVGANHESQNNQEQKRLSTYFFFLAFWRPIFSLHIFMLDNDNQLQMEDWQPWANEVIEFLVNLYI